jgi:regulator of cell morphogenesis and NO signaling
MRCEAMSIDSEVAGSGSSGGVDWGSRPLRDLLRHIRAHHDFTRAEFGRLRSPLETTVRDDGVAHPELVTVRKLFDELEADMLPHMMREERFIFPYIERIEAADSSHPAPSSAFGSVENPARMMMFEHQHDGALLESLRAATACYALPRGASATYALLYEGLRRLDADLSEHVRIENEVLFPRAIEAERALVRR